MENIDNELDGVQREVKKLDVIKKQLLKTTDFLRTGYQNRQRKKVAPSMTDSRENEPGQKTPTKNKTKLARKVAINIENFHPPAQIEDQDESSEDEDDWDSFSVSDFEYQDEELFCDVYHKCINIVGQDINNEFGKNSIISCLKGEFDFSDHQFETLIRSVENRQYPKLILKVDVLKVKDILPKDIFSVGDLFYVIWSSSNPSTFYHGKITKGMLKPIKDQKFEIPISSSSEDILHVELRDFIPFENEPDRKTQEVSQNIRAGESITEPIGSAQIMLKDIPSIGQTKWISLRRSSQNTCFGKLHIKMSFGSNENVKIALERHRCLVKKFLLRLMTEKDNSLNDWRGTFCPEAEFILKQHLIQSNLTYQDDLIAKWSGFIEMIRNNPVNFSIFDNLLDELLLSFEGNNSPKGKKRYFWNPARIMMSMCYNYIKNFRCRLNVSSQKEKLAQFHSVLSILGYIEKYEIPPNFNLFPTEFYQWIGKTDLTFQTVLHEFVVQGAFEWFEFLVQDNMPGNDTDEAKLLQMINVTEQVILDLQDGMDFHGIFVTKQNFSYGKTIFIVYQAKITEMMEIAIQKMCRGIKQLNIKECYQGNIDLNSFTLGSSMCTLFFKIQQFNKMGSDIFWNDDTFETFPMRRFHSWFSSGVIITWLDIAIVKAMRQIDEAVEMDNFTPVDSLNMHGSSAADMLNIIYQIRKFWVQLEWPDLEKCYSFLVKIIEDVFTVSIHYADLIIGKISNVGDEKKNYSTNHWCVAINNIDYISHKIQQFIVKLGVDELIHSLSDCRSMTAADRCKRSLTQMMNFSFEIMKQKTVDLLDTFSKEMDPSITGFLQEGAELLHQQPKICDTLTIYLDENLVTLNSKLSSEIFHRLLDVIWERISNILFFMIEDGIEKNRPITYFSNLKEAVHNLVGFFKIDEVLEDDRTKKISDILVKNERKLTIYGTETTDLIHMYYLERLQEQEAIEIPEDGVLAVNLHTENDSLIVEILNASNVIPMDSNGQSDPFVCVELIPLSKFSFFNYKTKVMRKTLYPMFGEKFTVILTKSQFQVKDALIKFTLKDQDLLSKNRYMAEAFIRLSDAAGEYEPRLYNLTLNRPRNLENDILKCLEARRNHDRWAKIFLKKEKARIRSTQEFKRFDF